MSAPYVIEFPHDAVERLIVVLRAYLDVGANRDTIALCGYVSSQERWDKFNGAWISALRDADNLPFFPMTDFEAAKAAPYRDWSPQRKARDP